MRLFLKYFFLLLPFLSAGQAEGQNWGRRNLRIGLAAPLYLDSAFNQEGYRYENAIPRFAVPGIDFINGAGFALDSIPMTEGNYLRVRCMDTKSAKSSLQEKTSSGELDDLDMIITSAKDEDFATLARYAAKRRIPFISATYPNDGGIRKSPGMVILNPTLRGHCEAIFSILLQEHGTDNIYLIRPSGEQENKVESIFKKCNRPDGKPLLKINTITLADDFSVIKSKLDSNKTSVIIGGSLDEEFAGNLCRELNKLRPSYRIKLIGMPNWEGFSMLRSGTLKDFPVYFTSSFLPDAEEDYQKSLRDAYRRKFNTEPSELFFRSFEAVHFFAGLLASYPEDPLGQLEKYYPVSRGRFSLKPVYADDKSPEYDYLENTRLHLLRSLNGRVSAR